MRRAAAGSPAPGGAPGVAPPSRSNTLLLLLRLFSLPLLLCQLLFVAVAVSGASASVVVPAPAPAPATLSVCCSTVLRYFSTAILQYSQTWDALVLPEMGSPRARLQAQALLDPAIPPSAVRACCHFGQHGVESLVQKSGVVPRVTTPLHAQREVYIQMMFGGTLPTSPLKHVKVAQASIQACLATTAWDHSRELFKKLHVPQECFPRQLKGFSFKVLGPPKFKMM